MTELLEQMKADLQKLPKCARVKIAKRYLERLEQLLNE
jgi:hypothetical protein